MKSFVNDIMYSPICTRIENNNRTVENIIKNVDVVFDCLDNIYARFIINDLCMIYRKPLIHAGVGGERGQVLFLPGSGPCLRCIIKTGEKTSRSVVAYTCAVASSLQVRELVRYIRGDSSARGIVFDLSIPHMRFFTIRRPEKCDSCDIFKR